MEAEKRIRREIANSNERRRMQSINNGFQSLRSLLPHHEGEKLSKVGVALVYVFRENSFSCQSPALFRNLRLMTRKKSFSFVAVMQHYYILHAYFFICVSIYVGCDDAIWQKGNTTGSSVDAIVTTKYLNIAFLPRFFVGILCGETFRVWEQPTCFAMAPSNYFSRCASADQKV